MNCSGVVKPLAEQDATAAYDYYESTVTELGSRFLSEIDRVLALISEHPEMYQEVLPGIRRALTRVFPYGIFYAFEKNTAVRYRYRCGHAGPYALAVKNGHITSAISAHLRRKCRTGGRCCERYCA